MNWELQERLQTQNLENNKNPPNSLIHVMAFVGLLIIWINYHNTQIFDSFKTNTKNQEN